MADLDPEEAAALAAAVGGGEAQRRVAVVSLRDFSEPRTLSADRIAHIRKTLSSRLQSISGALAGPLRGHPTLTICDVSEMNAQGLFDGFVRPFLVYGFQCGGALGWLIWDPEAARAAVDTILSGPPSEEDEPLEKPDPILTRTERRVAASLLDEVIGRITDEFGITCERGTIWQEPEELTTLEDLGPDSDSRRLLIHLSMEIEEGAPSDLCFYLPGIADPDKDAAADYEAGAPPHLAGVELDLSIHLGHTHVPLAELLAIEIGDVIPLDSRIGDAVEIEVEETICARGRFGARNGLLTVVVQEVLDISSPSEIES